MSIERMRLKYSKYKKMKIFIKETFLFCYSFYLKFINYQEILNNKNKHVKKQNSFLFSFFLFFYLGGLSKSLKKIVFDISEILTKVHFLHKRKKCN